MKKIAVLTSGGDAPGMNACIRAAVRFGLSQNMEMYGVMRGYEGLLKGDIFRMFRHSVTDIIQRGGTILKTARSERFFDEEGRKEARDRLAALGIEGLVVIGGDGSFNGAAKLACETDIKVACIPGTIDNDLNYTDYTLGFDTAVNTVLNAVNNIRDTMSSHDRACIVEVMGRSCGDIALFSAIGGGADAVVTPEKGLDLDALAAQLKQGEKLGKSSNIILLSEGVCSAQSLKEQLAAVTDMTLRTVTLGHVQRGGSPSLRDRLLAARFGVKAIECLIAGKKAVAVGVRNEEIVADDLQKALAYPAADRSELFRVCEILCR
ncbi:6-phosphofructokinase [Subdoligranulum sp. CAG:314]|jgi:6-phosphofructokinase|nr:6-phosphofructokinase [Subdoligranulum sp. CAG:314]